MNLFLDNDVLEKLAAWDLLQDGVRACGFELDAVRVLPSLKYRLGLAGKKRRAKYPDDVQIRIRGFVDAVQECADAPTAGSDFLVDVPNLDAGEAILFAHATQIDGAVLLTGDKRSIVAVATSSQCSAIVPRLAGRVLCLEQVLLRTVNLLGFHDVKARILNSNSLDLDTAVRAAFGSGVHALEQNACGSLERRVLALAAETSGLLASQRYRFAVGGDSSA